jgi:hypothetical protein
MLSINGIYCEGQRGHFKANADMLGWKNETSDEAFVYESTAAKRAEWFQGKFRVELCKAGEEEEEGTLLSLEGFKDDDLLALQQYFQQHCGIHIKCWPAKRRQDSPVQSKDESAQRSSESQPKVNSKLPPTAYSHPCESKAAPLISEKASTAQSPALRNCEPEIEPAAANEAGPANPESQQAQPDTSPHDSRKIRLSNLKQWDPNFSSLREIDDVNTCLRQTTSTAVMEGWVWKQSRVLMKWRRRWMKLTPSSIEWQARACEGSSFMRMLDRKAEEFNLHIFEMKKQDNKEITETAEVKHILDIFTSADSPHFGISCAIDTGLGFENVTFHMSCDSIKQKAAWVEKIRMLNGRAQVLKYH